MAEGDPKPPLSWRDVYDLVADTRSEVTDRIDSLAADVRSTLGTHEHRLTIAEEHLAHHGSAIDRLEGSQRRIGGELATLSAKQQQDEAATKALADARLRRWSVREKTLAAATALALAAATFLSLFLH